MTGIAVNDAPTASNLGTGETYTEDTPLNLTDIVVSDIDSANVTATLTLSTAAAGSLSTATSGAVTSTYNAGTGVWTASGALASVNTLLAGVTFNPAANFNTNFNIATSVSDGVAPAVTGSKTMTGIAVNDAPTASNLSAAETYTEDTALNLIDIVASDVDSASITVTLTLSNPPAGSLSTATSGAVTSAYNPATGVWTASGALANVNVLLAGLTFNPAANFNGNFSIATSVSDGVAPAITGSKSVQRNRGQRRPDGDQPERAADLHRGYAARPHQHRGERRGQRQRHRDADAVEHRRRHALDDHFGCRHLHLQRRHRRVDRERRDCRRQHLARGRDLYPGRQLQQQLHDRHQRQRRRGRGDHRQQDHDRHRGERRAHRHQPECRGDLHRRHGAQPDRHRGERRGQRQHHRHPDPVQRGRRQPDHGDLGRRHLHLQRRHRRVDRERRDRRRQHLARRRDLYPGANFNGNFNIATSVSDGVAPAITGSESGHRHRGQRRADGDQPERGGDLHRRYGAQPHRHRGERRRQRERHGDADAVEHRRREPDHRRPRAWSPPPTTPAPGCGPRAVPSRMSTPCSRA